MALGLVVYAEATGFVDLQGQCPLTSGPSQVLDSTVARPTNIQTTFPVVSVEELTVLDYCDTTKLVAGDFHHFPGVKYWTANANEKVAAGMSYGSFQCELTQVVATKRSEKLVEVRFLYDQPCIDGSRGVVATFVEKGYSNTNLVDWMCAIPGVDCKKAATTPTTTSTGASLVNHISITINVEERLMGPGICTGAGFHQKEVVAGSRRGCRLECSNRIKVHVNVDLGSECFGFAFNPTVPKCMLFIGAPVKGSSNGTVAGDTGFTCMALFNPDTSYAFDEAKTTTAIPTPSNPGLVGTSLDVSQALSKPGMATRQKIHKGGPDFEITNSDCFNTTDYFLMDTKLQIDDQDWSTLMGLLTPFNPQGPIVPSGMMEVSRVRVVACDGSVTSGDEECPVAGVGWCIVGMILTNLCSILITAWCCVSYCQPKSVKKDRGLYRDAPPTYNRVENAQDNWEPLQQDARRTTFTYLHGYGNSNSVPQGQIHSSTTGPGAWTGAVPTGMNDHYLNGPPDSLS